MQSWTWWSITVSAWRSAGGACGWSAAVSGLSKRLQSSARVNGNGSRAHQRSANTPVAARLLAGEGEPAEI